MGAMSTDDEALMLGQFAASFTADDHDAHADAALRVPPERKRERCRKVLADALVEVQDASMDEAWIRASAKDVAWALAPEKMGGK